MRLYLGVYGFRVLQLLLGFIAASWSARLFGVAGRGELAAAQTAVGLAVALGGMGIPYGVTHYVARWPDRLPQILGTTLLAALGMAAGSCVVVGLVSGQGMGPLSLAVYAGVIAQSVFLLLSSALTGVGEVAMASRLEAWVRLLWLALLGLWIYLRPATLVAMLGLQQLAYLLVLLVILKILVGRCSAPLSCDWGLGKEILPFNLRNYGSAIASTILITQNIFLLKYYRGAEEVGLFCSALVLGNLLYQCPQAFFPVLFRELSVLRDLDARWKRARPIVLASLAFSALGAIGLYLVGAFLIEHIFGTPFLAAMPALPWLLVGAFLMTCQQSCQPILAATGQPLLTVIGQFVIVVTDLSLNVYWIPRAGFVGASQVSVITAGLCLSLTAGHLIWLYYGEHGKGKVQQPPKPVE